MVELSIVIVIIGLIVACVVAGQNLVGQAKIRAQISDFEKFSTAFNAFKLQYNAIPGDLTNAGSYWSGVKNGNGDGKVTHNTDLASDINRENILFFEHLSRAGLVPETYTNTWALGVGYPKLKIDSGKGMIAGGLIYAATGGVAGGWQLSDAQASVIHVAVLYLNVSQPSLGGSLYNDGSGVTTPKVFSAMDAKFDDGVARTGMFKAYREYVSANGNCLTGNDGDYLLTNSGKACDAEYIIAK